MKHTRTDAVVIAICTMFGILSLGAVSQTGRERSKSIICQNNLRQLGLAMNAYLGDCDDRFPVAWNWLVKTEWAVASYQRYCRWHDPRFPLDGPLWPYLAKERTVLCPTFTDLAVPLAPMHPSHVASYPIDPQYSYSMNCYLGSTYSGLGGGVLKSSQITRNRAEVFVFGEENMWARPGTPNMLNDNALTSDGRDWFGTFHNAPIGDLNGGTVNAVFVDGHVQVVQSALGKDPNDKSQMENGRGEKYGWPYKLPAGQ